MNTEQLTFEQGVTVGAGSVFMLLLLQLILRPWIKAILTSCPVGLMNIIGIRLRGNPVNLLIDAYIILRKSGHDTAMGVVECIYINNRLKIKTPEDLAELTVKHLPKQDAQPDS